MVDIRRGEGILVLLSFLFHFFVLAAWYVLRPIRDAAGIRDLQNLPELTIAVLVAMFAVQPVFALLVTRLERRTFVPIAYQFFAATLVAFYFLFPDSGAAPDAWLARTFFVFGSIFNLFVVSVFWGVVDDIYDADQGARLFGLIATAGTVGAMTGSTLTATLVSLVGVDHMLLVSVALLEAALLCFALLGRRSRRTSRRRTLEGHRPSPFRGALDGFRLVTKSPYILGIALYILLYTATSNLLWFIKQDAVAGAFEDSRQWAGFLARIDLLQSGATLFVQIFITGALLSRFGSRLGLVIVPLITVLGFSVLGVKPILGLVVLFEVVRRSANYSLARPSREMLYTVVGKNEKFKAKTFIDTFVYRGGDAVGALVFKALRTLGLGNAQVAWCAVPVAAAWVVVGYLLGRRQKALASNRVSSAP